MKLQRMQNMYKTGGKEIMGSILIKNAKLRNNSELQQILIDDGKFKKIAKTIEAPSAEVIDASGNLVSPPFVDPHVHLDAVLSAGKLARGNASGTLIEAINIWSEWKAGLTKDILMENAREVIKWYIANGVLRVRTHVLWAKEQK